MPRSLLLAIAFACGLTASAAAQPPGRAVAGHDSRSITVMWAPLRLIIPLAEVTGEYRLADRAGASIMLGGGRRSVSTGTTDVPGTELEGGAQLRYYLLGSFTRGMEVGAEVLYEYVTFDEPLPPGVLAVAAGGLTVGPFVGYKIATGSGFTFEGQIGARYLVADPPVTGPSGVEPTIADDDRWLPLLHLNVGWTF